MGFEAGKSSKNAPAVCMYLLEHSVVILLDDAYKDQAHSVSPFDEEAAAELCLISNHHRRSPPQKKHFVAASTCFQCQTLLKTQTEKEKKQKQNKHTTNKTTPPVPNPKPTRALLLVHQLRATSQQQKRNQQLQSYYNKKV